MVLYVNCRNFYKISTRVAIKMNLVSNPLRYGKSFQLPIRTGKSIIAYLRNVPKFRLKKHASRNMSYAEFGKKRKNARSIIVVDSESDKFRSTGFNENNNNNGDDHDNRNENIVAIVVIVPYGGVGGNGGGDGGGSDDGGHGNLAMVRLRNGSRSKTVRRVGRLLPS